MDIIKLLIKALKYILTPKRLMIFAGLVALAWFLMSIVFPFGAPFYTIALGLLIWLCAKLTFWLAPLKPTEV